ncbi:MAG: DUF853 family protein [Proteobacteria bacterium]|nr:DUF853 family protein [Pseudomonadota bacterium]
MSEKLFIGRRLADDSDLLHKPDRLTTHGVVIGMTGSGKTGLSVTLVEELALQGVPVIALDPKGDLANLGLLFPALSQAEFEPWVDEGEARREGLTRAELAQQKADLWRSGLGKWGIDGARIAQLRDSVDLRIYTPGSTVGRPLDVLSALASPGAAALADADIRTDLVAGTTQALLGLVGVNADPIRSPEHLVIARIIDKVWASGGSLDLELLILQIVDPPFKKVGVFPVDKFWKPDKRMELAMRLNGVMASPSFASWLSGEPLDPGAMLTGTGGKTAISVCSMAHLSDTERMFFASLLLNRLVAWTRTQSGTSSLRALLYLDEAFGYMPPHPANPPTKKPLMTLMKQARAVGVGVLLATQNPVDLDYKGLTNAGNWFVGRLSTEQDVRRVSEGLKQAAAGADPGKAIGGLQPRQFLLRDVKESAPILFRSRWAMSFLRGPVTREELKRLPGASAPTGAAAPAPAAAPAYAAPAAAAAPVAASVPPAAPAKPIIDDDTSPRPDDPPGGRAWFLDPRSVFSARLDGALERFAEGPRGDGTVKYRPALYARLGLRFDEEKAGYALEEEHNLLFFPIEGRIPEEAIRVPLEASDLLTSPPDGARFEPLPEVLDEGKEMTAAKKRVVNDVYATEARGQWTCAPLKLHGKAGELKEDFQARCEDAVEDAIDEDLEKLARKYETKIDRVHERIRRKESQVERYTDSMQDTRTQELINGAELLAGFFLKKGRKKSIGTAASRRKATRGAKGRLEAAKDDLEALQLDVQDLQDELEEQSDIIRDSAEEALDGIEEREVRLEKTDIALKDIGILWVPVSRRV